MKIFKKVLLIIFIILFIFVILFGINIYRNNRIISNIANVYENDLVNLNNYYEYSKIVFEYNDNGEPAQESITESYYKDGIIKANMSSKMIEQTDYVKTIYYSNKNTGEELYTDLDGNKYDLTSKVKSDNGEIEIKNVAVSEKDPWFIMKINEEGAKGLIANNMFNYIKTINNCYVIKQNNKGEKLLVDKDTFIIRYRLDENNRIIWECKLDKDVVKDENIIKPEIKE